MTVHLCSFDKPICYKMAMVCDYTPQCNVSKNALQGNASRFFYCSDHIPSEVKPGYEREWLFSCEDDSAVYRARLQRFLKKNTGELSELGLLLLRLLGFKGYGVVDNKDVPTIGDVLEEAKRRDIHIGVLLEEMKLVGFPDIRTSEPSS